MALTVLASGNSAYGSWQMDYDDVATTVGITATGRGTLICHSMSVASGTPTKTVTGPNAWRVPVDGARHVLFTGTIDTTTMVVSCNMGWGP